MMDAMYFQKKKLENPIWELALRVSRMESWVDEYLPSLRPYLSSDTVTNEMLLVLIKYYFSTNPIAIEVDDCSENITNRLSWT